MGRCSGKSWLKWCGLLVAGCIVLSASHAAGAQSRAAKPPPTPPDISGVWTGKFKRTPYLQYGTSKAQAATFTYPITFSSISGEDLTMTFTIPSGNSKIPDTPISMTGSIANYTFSVSGDNVDETGNYVLSYVLTGHVSTNGKSVKGTGIIFDANGLKGTVEEIAWSATMNKIQPSFVKAMAAYRAVPRAVPPVDTTPDGLPNLDSTTWVGKAKLVTYNMDPAAKSVSKSYVIDVSFTEGSQSTNDLLMSLTIEGAGTSGVDLNYTLAGYIGRGTFSVTGTTDSGGTFTLTGHVSVAKTKSGTVAPKSIKGIAIDFEDGGSDLNLVEISYSLVVPKPTK